jgi:chromosome partitioning protein
MSRFIFIDCPPSLEHLTLNALTASDTVLVPVQCEYFALEGLTDLLTSIKMTNMRLNPKLQIEGLLLTMYDSRTNFSEQVSEDIRKHFGEKVFETRIPRNVRISEAPVTASLSLSMTASRRGLALIFVLQANS